MKKLFVIFVIFFAVAINAQKMSLGLGANVVLPMGTFGDAVSTGFGVGAKGEYNLQPKMNLTFSVGYISFGSKTTIIEYSYSIIPVLAGGKYFVDKSFYGMAELGMNFASVTVKLPANTFYIGQPASETTASESEFGYAFGGGYELPIGKAILDISVKYQNYFSDGNAISLGVAYKFGI